MKTPSSPAAIRIARLFSRRLITPWSDKEIKVFRGLVKQKCFDDDLHDLQLIERYYRSERMKGDKGIHRRDLATFLNNYHGELDRAKAWNENQTEKHKRKPSQIQKQRELSDEEFEALGDSFRKMVSELKTKLTHS